MKDSTVIKFSTPVSKEGKDKNRILLDVFYVAV